MIQRRFRSFLVIVLVVVVTSVGFAQSPSNGASISDTSRKVIYLESYVPTPGDVYTLSINYGINFESGSSARTENIDLILNADYSLEVPFIGSINVRTLTYDELRSQITARVRERSYAQFVSLNLTQPAIFDVLIWGGVGRPGFQSVSALTRLSDALSIAGGTTASGSHRQVELIREDGTHVYDLLRYVTDGDDSQNPFVRPGDRIRVPLLRSSVELSGAVANPGRIEILAGETIGDAIRLAGGLLPTAQLEKATVTRIGDNNRYAILDLPDVDVTTVPAVPGDVVTIPSSTTTTELVRVEGAIYTSPSVQGTPRSIPTSPVLLDVPYTPGLTLLKLLETFGGPTPFAESERSFVIRAGTGERSPIPDLGDLWESRRWDRDIPLAPGDRLVIPMKRLVVSVGGEVNAPGAFSFTSGYVVGDYLDLAGGIVEQDGSARRLFFAAPDGTLTPVNVDSAVPEGTTIYVGRSGWGAAKLTFTNIFTVTGWVTGIVGVATVIIQFIQVFNPTFP